MNSILNSGQQTRSRPTGNHQQTDNIPSFAEPSPPSESPKAPEQNQNEGKADPDKAINQIVKIEIFLPETASVSHRSGAYPGLNPGGEMWSSSDKRS